MEFNNIVCNPNKDNSQFKGNEKAYIKNLYHEQFGQWPGSCKYCYVKAWVQLNLYYKNNSSISITTKNEEPMSEQKFSIAKGKTLGIHGFPEVLTTANCNDEKALDLLISMKKRGHNPGKVISRFERYPADWEKLMNDRINGVSKPVDKKPNGNPAVSEEKVIAEETAEDNNGSAIEETREMLEGKSKKELQKMCKDLTLVEEEWKNLSKTNLIEYLIEKV